MAFHYVIDGYNLLYALPDMPSGSWQEKRLKLLVFLKERRPQGNNPMTVVFDSREGPGNQLQEKDLKVVYTSGETADDWISAHVREASNPRTLVVVSNDLGIRDMVRGTGARFTTCDEFLKRTSTSAHPPKQESPSNDSDITDEFRKKWL